MPAPMRTPTNGTTEVLLPQLGGTVDVEASLAGEFLAVLMIADAKSLTQFMDRDSRPDFTSTVMRPGLRMFLQNSEGVDSLLSCIERQKEQIFAS
jgi:multiple sugar transport system substrate-binding protein